LVIWLPHDPPHASAIVQRNREKRTRSLGVLGRISLVELVRSTGCTRLLSSMRWLSMDLPICTYRSRGSSVCDSKTNGSGRPSEIGKKVEQLSVARPNAVQICTESESGNGTKLSVPISLASS